MIDWDLGDDVQISLTSWLRFWIVICVVVIVGCCCITSLAGILGGY